jgi:hypothetical protein
MVLKKGKWRCNGTNGYLINMDNGDNGTEQNGLMVVKIMAAEVVQMLVLDIVIVIMSLNIPKVVRHRLMEILEKYRLV